MSGIEGKNEFPKVRARKGLEPIFAPLTKEGKMAVIGKIRERSGLLMIIVGGALVLFILGDFVGQGGLTRRDQVLGTVGDEDISAMEFERRVNDELESYRNDFGQPVNAQMTEQVRNSVWNEMVKERVMLQQVKDAGFALTRPEYDDIRFGNNILPDFRNQNFQGPDGQPDRRALQQYFENVRDNAPVYHEIQKRRITENRLYAKYTNLVKKSAYVNSAQALDEHTNKNVRATFSFVAKRYDSEPDSLYVVSDNDLRRYYDRHKSEPRHRQKPGRRFEYITFPVTASVSDIQETQRELQELRSEFATTGNDSLFVIANSDTRSYDVVPYMEGTADRENDQRILEAAPGEVVGPFRDGESFKLVKVKELANVPEARVRHILLSTQEKPEDEQRRRADSLLAVVKRDRTKFEDMVTKFSDDPGSVGTGGVYEWFDRTRMVPEFTAASFDEKVGAITIAKTTYGFHIVEVLGQREREERRVVTIERSIRPSPATFKEAYRRANDLSLRHKDPAGLRAAAEEQGLQVTPVEDFRPDMRYVPGLQQPNSVISFVNRAKAGEISEPLDAGDSYVVAVVTGIREEGTPRLEDVREQFTQEVIKEKKAEDFIRRMQGNTDLNALASELGVQVQTASDLARNTFTLPGGFSEYEVIGKIFALNEGDVSHPLRGETAVYVVSMTSKTEAPEPTDLASEKSGLAQRVRSRAESNLFNALRESVGVRDDRARFY
jgi:peptidyl-prolyl cis-trans isomerase D